MLVLIFILCLAQLISEVSCPNRTIFDKFQQNDYRMKFERLEVVSFDKRIIRRFEIITFKYNRTCAVINFTIAFNINVGSNLEVIVQAYKFMSNEYRHFPLRFQVNFCVAVSKNLVGILNFAKCGNFSGCPFQKGRILHVCNWTPDESKYPPFIPDGRYMVEFQLLYGTTEAAVYRSYSEVTRPLLQ